MRCLWCQKLLAPIISWETIVTLPQPQKACQDCLAALSFITGPRCSRCSRSSTEDICADCEKWLADDLWRDTLAQNHSVFVYNERMKEVVAKWKYRGDYVLAEIFKEALQLAFREHYAFLASDTVIVPIPLSTERLQERGFNQAHVLSAYLPLESRQLMTRIHSEKQAKKTRKERMAIKNPFNLTEKVNKPVVLVDDIYTTGATLHHAARLLRENGCPHVYALTLIRG